MTSRTIVAGVAAVATGLTLAVGGRAQSPDLFNERLVEPFTYRNVGPFRIGARTSDIAVPAAPAKAHLYTFYVSFWSGGVWKTTNNGTTFTPVFDAQSKLNIGDVTLAPSNPDIVWVGTGDAFTSRSSYRGDGVYKSIDAGKTWKNMGLKDSQHISRIAIHPTNPNLVYVAAMGHLYSTNDERGVFRTTDGGETWQKVLYVNEKVGVIDLVMNPKNPDVLFAATYEKERLPWQIVNGGPGSGIYKTTDGGKNWTKLGGGLPSGKIGRIGLDICLSKPDILYAVIENENTRGSGSPGSPGSQGSPGSVVNTIGGEVYRTNDSGQTWTKVNPDEVNVSPKGPYYFSQIRVDPNNELNLWITQDGYRHSTDGGKTWDTRDTFPRMFGDYRTLWIDPENSDRVISGSDGGIAISYDGGRTSDAYANIPVGEVYAMSVDNEEPYNIYAGLQDHENWKGPSNTGLNRVTPDDWVAVGDGDGMSTLVDPNDNRWIYTNREYGAHSRVDQKNGTRVSIVPRRAAGQPPYRFIWETPIVFSPFDTKTIYTGGQVLLRSTDRGDHWTEISPDLSTNPPDKILPSSEGGVPGGIPWFAISTISESPVTKGVIWAGTSDGNVQMTRDDGKAWTNMTAKIAAVGGRADAYASRVQASSHVAGRAYVSKSGYKLDDFRPFVYRTNDFGATWTSIAGNLPNEPINVVYEDRKNPNLLFVGNDTGVFVTIDGGARWVKMNNNIPNISVHDLLVHPRDNDLILGTYGRDIFITNIAPLQELTPAILTEDAHLFQTEPTVQRITWSFGANDYLFGQRHASTPNDAPGMHIRYYLKTASAARPTVVVTNATGQEVARCQGGGNAGINTVVWSMRAGAGCGGAGGGRGGGAGAGAGAGAAAGAGAGARAAGAGAGAGAGGGAGAGARAAGAGGAGGARAGGAGAGRGGGDVLDQWAPLGDYTITLEIGDKKLTHTARITHTQGWSLSTTTPQIIR